MRVIAFIEEMDVIRKILEHLGLWDDKRRPVPTANSPPAAALQYTIENAIPSANDMTVDPIYSVKAFFENPTAMDKGGLCSENEAASH